MQCTKVFRSYLLTVVQFALCVYSLAAYPRQPDMNSGEIHGTVYRWKRQEPLATAHVQLIETGRCLVTDENGEFRFTGLAAGEYTLSVSAAGYRAPEDDEVVIVKPGGTTETKIYLQPVEFRLEEIEVTSKLAPVTVGVQSLGGLELRRIPGTAGDALRALGALPGIGVGNDFSGELHIRGGAPEDNRFYFDRTPIGGALPLVF